MRVRVALRLSLAVALLLSASPAAATALNSHEVGDDRRQDIRISLQEDGDAVWSVEHHRVLNNESERDRFMAFASEVKSGQRDVGSDRATFARFLPLAEEQTKREMAIEDAGWESAQIRTVSEVSAYDETDFDEDTRIGTLRFTFTWTNFARTDDGYLHLQETFQTAAGDTWFPGLTPIQRLIIEAPSNHDFVTAPTGVEDDKLVWNGPASFEPDTFDIDLVSRSGPLGLLGDVWPLLLGGATLIAVLAGAGIYLRRRSGESTTGDRNWSPLIATLPTRIRTLVYTGDRSSDGGRTAPPTDEEATSTVETTDSIPHSESAVDPELLSDEERVTHLLNRNGGRMKQAAIVDETGWSNAKVSQLLSQMDEDDDIEKLRIGRENLITLPDVDPTQVE